MESISQLLMASPTAGCLWRTRWKPVFSATHLWWVEWGVNNGFQEWVDRAWEPRWLSWALSGEIWWSGDCRILVFPHPGSTTAALFTFMVLLGCSLLHPFLSHYWWVILQLPPTAVPSNKLSELVRSVILVVGIFFQIRFLSSTYLLFFAVFVEVSLL